MKKISLLVFSLLALGLLKTSVFATDYSTAITTNPITEAGTIAAQINGARKIHKLIISSSSTAQSVTVYEQCGSTTTVTSVFTLQIPANSPPVILDYPFGSPLSKTDVCFRKTDSSTTVYVIAHYR